MIHLACPKPIPPIGVNSTVNAIGMADLESARNEFKTAENKKCLKRKYLQVPFFEPFTPKSFGPAHSPPRFHFFTVLPSFGLKFYPKKVHPFSFFI